MEYLEIDGLCLETIQFLDPEGGSQKATVLLLFLLESVL